MTHNIEVESGKSVKLPTAGKYCDRDILVTGNGYTEADMTAKYDEGKADGITEGKQAEYDAFWDGFQNYGNRTIYYSAFGYVDLEKFFFPKYDIKPSGGSSADMFRGSVGNPIDLTQRLSDCGVVLDTSKNTSNVFLFAFASVVRVPTISFEGITSVSGWNAPFRACYSLHTIDGIVPSPTYAIQTTAFDSCTALKNITFKGTIWSSGLDLHWSTKLSRDSITNIVGQLSTTASGKSITLSKTAVNNAFTDAEWATLANTRSNWTINLV